jgi:hypothetical protein
VVHAFDCLLRYPAFVTPDTKTLLDLHADHSYILDRRVLHPAVCVGCPITEQRCISGVRYKCLSCPANFCELHEMDKKNTHSPSTIRELCLSNTCPPRFCVALGHTVAVIARPMLGPLQRVLPQVAFLKKKSSNQPLPAPPPLPDHMLHPCYSFYQNHTCSTCAVRAASFLCWLSWLTD